MPESWPDTSPVQSAHAAFFPHGWNGRGPLLFLDPIDVVTAETHDQVPHLLRRLDEARASGLWFAGWLAYDAMGAYGDVPGITSQSPCGVFGIFKAPLTGPDTDACFKHLKPFTLAPKAAPKESPSVSAPVFQEGVKEILEALRRGDCYQVNLTEETTFQFEGDARALFRRLYALQPGAHSALVIDPHRSIVSLSPELLFDVVWTQAGAVVETRPVKGTTPRSGDPVLDQSAKALLATDEKLRAENLMIVDLLRNDLGLAAIPGSVEVPALFNVDTLPSLHHSYSTVRAAFNADVSARFFRDVIPAIFPGGSITGAPKQAAMKLITELEKRPRGVYTGMIGFGGPDYAAFNVAIRTLEIEKSGHTRLGTGCGIVWESDPVLEEYESGLKRSFAQAAMSDFRIIESIRLAGGRFTLLARHLSRLKRAARHFAVPWNGSAVISALRKALQASTGEGPAQKIRLTVDQNGRAEALATGVVGKRRPVVLAVSDRNVYSGDVYRRFKTSERQMYDAAFKRVTGAGLADDVIFMNESGEVVETAIANILIRSHDGAFITPPQSSGALTGTLLSALETRRKGRREPIVRSRLCMADLLRARSVWTVNSVRGILRVSRIVDGDGRALRDFKRVGPT